MLEELKTISLNTSSLDIQIVHMATIPLEFLSHKNL